MSDDPPAPQQRAGSLFAGIPADLPAELTEELVRSEHVRIERIVSRGHTSLPGFWYDQEENEWVVVLSGWAELTYSDGSSIRLGAGDWISIPAGVKHRVEGTDPDQDTVWLAIFF